MIKIIENESYIEVYSDDNFIAKFDSIKYTVETSNGLIYVIDKKSPRKYRFCTGKENAYYINVKEST